MLQKNPFEEWLEPFLHCKKLYIHLFQFLLMEKVHFLMLLFLQCIYVCMCICIYNLQYHLHLEGLQVRYNPADFRNQLKAWHLRSHARWTAAPNLSLRPMRWNWVSPWKQTILRLWKFCDELENAVQFILEETSLWMSYRLKQLFPAFSSKFVSMEVYFKMTRIAVAFQLSNR